ncbi:transcription termination factor NusA [Neomegalonema perideroedes]|uniref:transcription termination factor NusA n=1 Tax=Neomegalonema perideroedes TaxID=217219 RepID=UPI0003604450|nr:transcription termination factor NusA [Neomegalonema perideroedes]
MVSANRLELLQIADAVAREKGIDRLIVIEAMEDAIQKAARSRYGAEYEIRCKIDPRSGEMSLARIRRVTPEVENHFVEILVQDAQKLKPGAVEGDEIVDPLPPLDFSGSFGRIAAQTAKQVIVQKVREAERDQQFEEYRDRIDSIVNGTVKRVEYSNVIVDLGRAEGVIRRDQLIRSDAYRIGDRVRCYVMDVRREARGPQIFLSRTHPQFMAKLFAQEVPEIYDGVIEIRAVARDPGSRAKIGVISHDDSIDPVGACVGMRGSRVQAVVQELGGEKIDIIPWSEDPVTFIVNALQPAEVAKVLLDEDAERIEVVVPDDQQSLAIGRRGQNVRLASQLTGWDIDITTEAAESERRQKIFAERAALFMNALGLEEMTAQLLATEGFESVDELAYAEDEELQELQGLPFEAGEAVRAKALAHLAAEDEARLQHARDLGMQEDLMEFEGLSAPMLEALAESGVKTLQDFAEMADWELAGGWSTHNGRRVKDEGVLEKFDLSAEEARSLIIQARAAVGMISAEEIEAMHAAMAAAAEAEAAEAEAGAEAGAEEAAEGAAAGEER